MVVWSFFVIGNWEFLCSIGKIPLHTAAPPAKSIMVTRGPQNGQWGVQRGLTIGSAAGRAACYKKRYSVLSFLLIKDWIPYQVKATRDFIPFSKGMEQIFPLICYIFLESDPSI